MLFRGVVSDAHWYQEIRVSVEPASRNPHPGWEWRLSFLLSARVPLSRSHSLALVRISGMVNPTQCAKSKGTPTRLTRAVAEGLIHTRIQLSVEKHIHAVIVMLVAPMDRAYSYYSGASAQVRCRVSLFYALRGPHTRLSITTENVASIGVWQATPHLYGYVHLLCSPGITAKLHMYIYLYISTNENAYRCWKPCRIYGCTLIDVQTANFNPLHSIQVFVPKY